MSKELLSEELMKKEYPILGASLMAKKYNVRRRYCICRASNLGIKLNKKVNYCNNCKKNISPYSIRKRNLCHNCSAKLVYKKRGKFTHNNGRIFTEQEIDILKDKYYDSEKKKLLKLLNRSWCSIQHKAERLKIKRNLKFMEEGNKKGRKWFKENNPIHNPIIKAKARRNYMKWLNKNPDKLLNRILRRNYMTSLEKRVKRILDKHNIVYKHNKYIKTKTSYRFPDFKIDNLIIECDGKRFHQDKDKENKRNRELIDAGFEILHFSEYKINKNIKKVEKCILSKLNERNMLKQNKLTAWNGQNQQLKCYMGQNTNTPPICAQNPKVNIL